MISNRLMSVNIPDVILYILIKIINIININFINN